MEEEDSPNQVLTHAARAAATLLSVAARAREGLWSEKEEEEMERVGEVKRKVGERRKWREVETGRRRRGEAVMRRGGEMKREEGERRKWREVERRRRGGEEERNRGGEEERGRGRKGESRRTGVGDGERAGERDRRG